MTDAERDELLRKPADGEPTAHGHRPVFSEKPALTKALDELLRLRPVVAAAEEYRVCWLQMQRDGDDVSYEEQVMARDELFDALHALNKAVADAG